MADRRCRDDDAPSGTDVGVDHPKHERTFGSEQWPVPAALLLSTIMLTTKDGNRTCYQETFLLINMILLGVQTAFVVVTTLLIVMEMMVYSCCCRYVRLVIYARDR